MTASTRERTAVVVPGGRYGPYIPLLWYAADAARARGARVRSLKWTPPADLFAGRQPGPKAPAWVHGQVGPVLDEVTEAGGPPLVIGKSLGTYAAALTAERGLPAIWFTPLLTEDAVAGALRRAAAPCLLVGGTADEWWDGAAARKLSPHVYEVDGAGHGLMVPGPLAGSAAVLGQVATAVERFLDETVWPRS
jgi:pimeloyl-ACP methyl ester carboxylesterase